MCEYCEKGKRIKNDKQNLMFYILWKDCVPEFHIDIDNGFGVKGFDVLSIDYCPWCGRDLINNQYRVVQEKTCASIAKTFLLIKTKKI